MRIRKLTLATAVATATLAANQAIAQGDLFVEEILVTARKQTETIQDVPLSLSAFGAEEIEAQAIETTEDVIKLSPGLTFTRGIGGQDLRPDIRGLTPLSGRANVAILVDGVDMTTDSLVGTGAGQLVGLGLYDLERVEVVRGPQSALFGRNAFGGAINYITKKPTAEFEGQVSLEYNEWDTYKGKLGLSGPITDSILYRLNIAGSEVGAEYNNSVDQYQELGGDNTKSISLALQFLPSDTVEILTRLDYSDQEQDQKAVGAIKANACFTNDYDDTVNVITGVDPRTCSSLNASSRYDGTVSSFDEKDIQLSSEPGYGTETELLQWTTFINWEINDDFVFTSNTAFTDMEGNDRFDLDHSPTVTSVGDCTPGPDCAAQGLSQFQLSQIVFPWVSEDNPFAYISDRDYERQALFQDFRLSFDNFEGIRWLVGMEFFAEEYTQEDYSRANGITFSDRNGGTIDSLTQIGNQIGFVPGVGVVATPVNAAPGALSWDGSPQVTERDSTSWSIYGSVDWMFVEDWELSVSFRYQQDEFDINYDNGLASGVVPGIPLDVDDCAANGGTGPGGCATVNTVNDYALTTKADGDFEAFNPRVVLTWYTTDDVMLYASVAKGTKPGGHTVEPDISAAPGADVSKLTYGQEELLSYEFGWKTSWFEDRMIVNGAVYYMENEDKQANNREYVTYSGTPRSYVDNIGETEIRGLELQISGVITSFWTASLNYAFIDTEITDFTNQSAYGIPSPPQGTPADVATELAEADPDANQAGNELPYTPKHNVQLTNEFEMALGSSLDGFFRVDGRMMSERWLTTDNYSKLDDYVIWDIKAGIRHSDFEVIAFLDNVEDQDTPSSGVTFPRFAENLRDQVLIYPQGKRTAGVRFKYYF